MNLLNHWRENQKLILAKWGVIEEVTPKELVLFSENKNVKVRINYELGELDVSMLADVVGEKDYRATMQEALNNLIDPDNSIGAILGRNELLNGVAQIEPPKKIKNQNKVIYQTRMKLNSDHLKLRSKRYRPLVEQVCSELGLEVNLVMAIIHQESAFNPKAMSHIPAFGLMQIVPKYAGKDVYQSLKINRAMPSTDELFDPLKNIFIGSSYLKMLKENQLSFIKDPLKQKYLMICSYNWGIDRILNNLNRGRIDLSKNSDDVFHDLLKIVPDETKDYLLKVTSYESMY